MRERRHPHQVMEIAELSVGGVYAFVSVWDGEDPNCTMRTVAALVPDTIGLAKRRGWNPDMLRTRPGEPTLYQRLLPLETLLDGAPLLANAEILTVHLDGWSEQGDTGDCPTLSYWAESGGRIVWRGWDEANMYCLDSDPQPKPYRKGDRHCIVVPWRHWLDDPPGLHAAVADPAGESAADFDRRMRAKRDEAMRRFFA